MGKIKVNLIQLDCCISNMKNFKSSWANNPIVPPDLAPDSQAIIKIAEQFKVYEDLYKSLMGLMQNTIDFMTNTKSFFRNQDNNLAKQYEDHDVVSPYF